jgi:DNA-binding MarR family transcriptional regulator
MDRTPEADADLLRIATDLHHGSARLSRLLRSARPAEGLSIAKLAVLERLHRQGPATATVLASYLRIQPQSLTRLLAFLERRKLIQRKSDKADRRQSHIRITDAGTRLLSDDVRARRVHLAQAIGEALTPVERELLRLASTLIERVADATEHMRSEEQEFDES